jgi:hypothetical protein
MMDLGKYFFEKSKCDVELVTVYRVRTYVNDKACRCVVTNRTLAEELAKGCGPLGADALVDTTYALSIRTQGDEEFLVHYMDVHTPDTKESVAREQALNKLTDEERRVLGLG